MSPAGVDGSPATLLVQLDSQTPTLSFAGHASQSKWYDSVGAIPELDTDATTGASGLASIDCSGDGIANQSAAASGTAVALSGLHAGDRRGHLHRHLRLRPDQPPAGVHAEPRRRRAQRRLEHQRV